MNRPLRKLCLALPAAVLIFANGAARAQDFKVRTEFPSTDGRVYAIAVDDFNRVVYIGGLFSHVGGEPRDNIAAINLDTGALLPFAPQLNGKVRCLTLSGITLYVGGEFTTANSIDRKRGVAFQTTDGSMLAWDPNVTDGSVYTIAVDGTFAFLGGTFTQVGAVAAFRLANTNATTGAAANWTPNPEAAVNAIATYNGFAYTGGDFSTIGGKAYRHLATLDGGGDGSAFTGWFPNPSDNVYALLFDDTKLYVGGSFFGVPTDHAGLAIIDRSTGNLDTSFPDFVITLPVKALALSGTHLYLGGAFTDVLSQERKYLASIDTGTKQLQSWNPGTDNFIDSVAVNGYTVFVGGAFTTIGGAERTGFAAIIDYSLPGAPSPDKPAAGAPTITVSGKKKITTTKSKLMIKGTATNAAKVEVKVGKTGYKAAKGITKWSFKAKLTPGKNAILVRAINSTGVSSPVVKISVKRE